jgi:protein-disulfide isomerase
VDPEPEPVAPSDAPVPQPARTDRGPILVGLVVVGLVTVVLVALIALGGVGGDATRPDSAAGGSPQPSASPDAGFSSAGRAIGMPGAPVTVEIWADFQCPFCRLSAHGTEPALIREFAATGAARVVFRDFAFLGQESVDAAVAGRCAERQDGFWRYHDLLFASQAGENQGAFARQNLVGLARFAGLDTTAFAACLDDATLAAEVASETAAGRELGIDSTPTIRVSGPNGTHLLTGLNAPATVADVIERGGQPAPGDSPDASAAASPPATGGRPSASP